MAGAKHIGENAMRRLLLAALLLAPLMAAGQEPAWPAREAVRVVVCAPAGSTVDLTARLWTEALKDRLGANFVVDPRAGAGGMIGAEAVARARPDGYTLGVCFPGPFTMRPHLVPNLPIDPLKDLRPVALLMTAPFVFVVDARLGTTLPEFVAKAKASDLSYASVGNGSLAHLGMELFLSRAGVRMVHVPYAGSPPALADILGGRVAALITPLSGVQGHISEGRLAALFATGPDRLPQLPSVPTAREAGLPDLEIVTWHGLFAPRGTPEPIVARLAAAVADAVRNDTRLQDGMSRAGAGLVAFTPAQAEAMIAAESATWQAVIRAANIKAE
jgi:tripartite-type tricarboxylate transporter receptor subunit TctC